MAVENPKQFLADLFDVAVAAADPHQVMARYLPEKPVGRTIVLGVGKAAGALAKAFVMHWDGEVEGALVVPHGVNAEVPGLETFHAAHPVPDVAGLAASQHMLERVSGLNADDLVVALVSGGGSALLPCPAESLTLEDEIAVNRALLRSGAPISQMNMVRKCVSGVKGGCLAAMAHPAKVVSLIVSDVPGDYPEQVSSGPTVADDSTAADALRVVARYRMALPDAVMQHLEAGTSDAPLPGDARLARAEHHIIASARMSLEAAAEACAQQGIEAQILSDAMEGEARHLGTAHAAIVREIALRDRPFVKPVLLLSGGETTVTMGHGVSPGKGGRNAEFLLSLAMGIEGLAGVHALAADTDGIDGSADNAGAYADGTTCARIFAHGDPGTYLFNHDAWTAFRVIDDLLVTGPTGTNVNDFRAILIA